MPFDIKIRVDPSGASPGIKKVEGDLDKLEKKGEGVGKTIQNSWKEIGKIAGGVAIGTGMIAALESANQAAKDLEDTIISLENKAQKFTDGLRSTNDVLAEQTELASKLHTTAGHVIEVYDAVGDATDDLNLSLEQQRQLTETLGQSAILAGKSLGSVGDSLMGISVAWQTGGNAARQVRSFLRENHDLAVALEHAFGKSSKEIIEGIEDGTITYRDFVEKVVAGGREVQGTFNKIKKTNKEWDEQFVETASRAAKAGDDAFTAIAKGIAFADDAAQKSIPTWNAAFADLISNLDAIAAKADDAAAAQRKIHEANAKEAREGLADLQHQINEAEDFNRELRIQMDEEARKKAEEYNKVLKERLEIAKALVGSESVTERAIRQAAQERAEFQADVERAAQAEIDAEKKAYDAAIESSDAKIEAEKAWHDAVAKYADEAAQKRIEFAKKEIEAHAQLLEAALSPFKDALVDAATTGEFAFDKMFDSIQSKLAQLAADALFQSLISSLTGAPNTSLLGKVFGGFATGGTVRVPFTDDPLYIPRAASGWDGMIGGAGGTDSKLFMAHVTPGEYVHINTPEQEAAMGGAQGGTTSVKIVNRFDSRELLQELDTPNGERVILNIIRRNKRHLS